MRLRLNLVDVLQRRKSLFDKVLLKPTPTTHNVQNDLLSIPCIHITDDTLKTSVGELSSIIRARNKFTLRHPVGFNLKNPSGSQPNMLFVGKILCSLHFCTFCHRQTHTCNKY